MEKRILFLITGLARGGAETQLTQLALRLKARNWEVKVISMTPPRAYKDLLHAADIPVVSLNVRSRKPDPRPILRLVREVRQWRPQIMHSFMVHANLLARLIRPFVSVPVLLCSIRSINEGGKLREALYRVTDKLCTLTTHVSREGKERYISIGAVPPRKIIYIPNGVNTKRFYPNRESYLRLRVAFGVPIQTFLWLAVGRLVPAKDYPLLLQAFAQVSAKQPLSSLWIVGEGPLRSDLQALTKKLGIEGRVAFLGLREDVPELMRMVDGFVLSSAWEGMPNVVLEAAASGLPVVSTQVSGVTEIVLEGETGYLVPPRNPPALAQAMLRLMLLPESLRRNMGLRARKYVKENFNIESIVDRWEELYFCLLEQRGVISQCGQRK